MTTFEPPNIAPSSDLPIHLTRFVGRERELAELDPLLQAERLLTLTGAGGSGKTRLAREAASRVGMAFDRVAWIDLAPIATGDLVPQQIATALHVHDRPGVTPLNLLIETLRAESALLVLDNCEHVVDACATLAESLLRACPRLTLLATSREALGVPSETAWLVPALAMPEAMQLFTERARLVLPAFAITDANRAAVQEICRRLDGIPLAIELAAARARVLSPAQIATRLDDAFHVLSGGSRTALPRHRTLRATMEWSYSLLATREQVLLRRLSIFAGSFTLDSAEVVCAGDPLDLEDILDGVTTLVDKSLVVMESGDGVARYRLLETVRQYGAERIDEALERDAVALRFAEHYVALVEEIAPKIVGGAIEPGLNERLSTEYDNIRAAVAWACEDAARAELALRFVGGLAWFWYAIGQFREARQFEDRALALNNANISPLIVGRAHLASALTAFFQGDSTRAFIDFEAAIPLLEHAGDPIAMGTALSKYGGARILAGDVDASIGILDEAVAFIQSTPENDITRIFAVFWRGLAAFAQGDYETARELVGRVLTAGRKFALPTTTGHSLSTLAQIELARDNLDEACGDAGEALEIEVASGDGWGIALALDAVTRIAARRGHRESAARLVGAVDAHRKRIAVGLPGIAPRAREALIAELRASRDLDYDALYAEGYGWPMEQAIAIAMTETVGLTAERRIPTIAPVPREAAAAQPSLRVLALGPLQVSVGDRVIDTGAWGSARPRELLVYLLMHPEGRTKEQVGLALWPEASSGQLRNNFHVTTHRLRKALGGGDWVTHVGDRYRIEVNTGLEFDALAFEREMADATQAIKRREPDAAQKLEKSLERYRGDFLDGEPVGDWHLEHRDRLQRLYLDGLMRLGALFTAQERHARAADVYRRVLARDELHEEAVVALMRSHVGSGERAQALRIYQRYSDKLREELDAEPDGESAELAEQLQRGGAVST